MKKAITWIVILMALACLSALIYVEYFILHPLSDGLTSPDFRFFGYTYEEFTQWQSNLGEDGVAAYIKWFPQGIDNYLPALAGLTIILLLHQILNKFPRYRSRTALLKNLLLSIFSLPYVFFDYFENLVVLDALTGKGSAGASAIQFASSVSVLKASFLTISLVVMAVLYLASMKTKESTS